jgi:hypothetical protein
MNEWLGSVVVVVVMLRKSQFVVHGLVWVYNDVLDGSG